MNYEDQRLEAIREEQRRYEQQREWQRQTERDEFARRENHRALDSQLHNKESANRCANNDGPATMGGLCVACYAAQRAAEDAASRGGADALPGQQLWGPLLETLPLEVHHFASDKSMAAERTQMAEEIARKYDLDLAGEWNTASLRHRGRHPDEYHAYVLGTMAFIDEQAKGNREEFLRLYDELVRHTVMENPEMLRKRAWYE